jgi:hypothetical protein
LSAEERRVKLCYPDRKGRNNAAKSGPALSFPRAGSVTVSLTSPNFTLLSAKLMSASRPGYFITQCCRSAFRTLKDTLGRTIAHCNGTSLHQRLQIALSVRIKIAMFIPPAAFDDHRAAQIAPATTPLLRLSFDKALPPTPSSFKKRMIRPRFLAARRRRTVSDGKMTSKVRTRRWREELRGGSSFSGFVSRSANGRLQK